MLDEVRTFKGGNGAESELTQAERAFVQQITEDRAVGGDRRLDGAAGKH